MERTKQHDFPTKIEDEDCSNNVSGSRLVMNISVLRSRLHSIQESLSEIGSSELLLHLSFNPTIRSEFRQIRPKSVMYETPLRVVLLYIKRTEFKLKR